LAGGFIHVDAEQLVAGAYFLREGAVFALLQKAAFAKVAATDGTGKIIAVKEGRPLNFQRCPGQLPGIVRMQEQYPRVAADYFNPLIKGGAPGAALEVIITVAVTAPAAFQHDALVKTHLLGSDQRGKLGTVLVILYLGCIE